MASMTRKEFLASAVTALAMAKLAPAQGGGSSNTAELSADDVKVLERASGVTFTEEERNGILSAVRQSQRNAALVRGLGLDDQIAPPTPFVPQGRQPADGAAVSLRPTGIRTPARPKSDDELAFLSVLELSALIKSRKISSAELTEMYLGRLRKYGEPLLCLVTLTEDLAMRQARQADEEIARGRYRGPLHGIPYGLKDLFAVPGYVTTWGSEPHRLQRIENESAVYRRLSEAGAVLVAKLSMGALAQGDVWFKGRTKNPWNLEQGSSGSSAGSACATAAGLVGFSIGTETLGSIMSPSHQCRVSGLRPTFGRVSKQGAMALSWTMDKIGPICRTIEDCALVFASLVGQDPSDDTTVSKPFHWRPGLDLKRLKIAYLAGTNDAADRLANDEYLKALVDLGLKLDPIRFTAVPPGVNLLLSVEAAAAFDTFTRGDRVRELKNSAWPNTFRTHRLLPAVDYLAAQRARRQVMETFEKELGDYDLVVTNERGGNTLFITNLTGHPQALIPLKRDERSRQRSCSVIGRLYEEDKVLALARVIQAKVGPLAERPDLSSLENEPLS